MKIEIDLNDILHDGYGEPTESLAESIRRQVVEHVASEAKKTTEKRISEEVSRVLDETLTTAVKEQVPGIIAALMDQTYTPVGRYGDRTGPTTVRAEMLKKIQEEMVYKPGGYSSDKNAYTKAVDATVDAKLSEFKEAWLKQVDSKFVADALDYASMKLRERLGLK